MECRTSTEANAAAAIRYSSTFQTRLLGSKCDVTVTVDLAAGTGTAIAAMRQPLRSTPSCYISLDELKKLRAALHEVHRKAELLDQPTEGADDHRLDCLCGAATLILVKPRERPCRFTLTIGEFHREGVLDDLSASEIEDAISEMEGLRTQVMSKCLPNSNTALLGRAVTCERDGMNSPAPLRV